MIFTTEGFFEIAIGETAEWDLNPLPLNSVQMLKLTDLSGHELNLHSEPTLYSNSSFLGCSVWDIILAIVFVSHHLFQSKFFWGNHMGVAEWTVIYVFTTEGSFEVAIETWPECDLIPGPLNSIQAL